MNQSTFTPEQIHTDAMLRTADFYDDLKPTIMSGLNSNSTGTWIFDAALSGGWLGPRTEHTKNAEEIVKSYDFSLRRDLEKVVRYPIEGEFNQHGEPVTLVFTRPEKSAFPIKTVSKLEDNAHSLAAFTLTKSGKTPKKLNDSPKSAYSGTNVDGPKKHRETPAESRLIENENICYHYHLVSEVDLNAQYAKYLTGDATAQDVLNDVVNFVMRKILRGSNEYKLRSRGETDLLGEFWKSVSKGIEGKRCTGVFSHYIHRAWCNRRNSRYEKVKIYDNRHESLTDRKDTSEDEGWGVIVGRRDRFAVESQHVDQQRADEIINAELKVEEVLSMMDEDNRLQAKSMLLAFERGECGDSQKEAAAERGITRYSLRRRQEHNKKKVVAIRNGSSGITLQATAEMA